MKSRDIVLAIIVVVLLLVLFQRLRSGQQGELPELADSEVPIESIESSLEGVLGRQIPDNVQKTELKSQGGFEGTGIATRDDQSTPPLLSVLADLPSLLAGTSYEVFVKNTSSDDFVSIGIMQNVKGGWLLEYMGVEVGNISEIEVRLNDRVVLQATF